MYTEEQLGKFDFFREKLRGERLADLLDSLTGLVTRSVMIGFIHAMIDEEIPFTLAMVDLDNFKLVNDNYGHKVGDEMLSKVAADMIDFLGEDGVVGRFGGDEFLMINFRCLTYDSIHEFYDAMCENETVFRKKHNLESHSLFVSATIGSATFPTDAKDYDGMFELIDKTLYRGKSKGRNCFIIYVERLHKDLTVEKLAKHSLLSTMQILAKAFDEGEGLPDKLFRLNGPLCAELRIRENFFIDNLGDMYRFSDFKCVANVSDMAGFVTENEYHSDEFEAIKKISPKMYRTLSELNMETVMITRIYRKDVTYGFLLCQGDYSRRLWQSDEQALSYFAARLVAEYLDQKGNVHDAGRTGKTSVM